MTHQVSATIAQPSIPNQSIESYPTPTKFSPPADWQVYKSEFRHQYSYPSSWRLSPEIFSPSSSVSAPGTKYPDGRFVVEREAGGADTCESRRKSLLKGNPAMQQTETMISEHPALQIEGKSRLYDGYNYDRKSVFVIREDTCFHLHITSRKNSGQLVILNQILSTFEFSD